MSDDLTTGMREACDTMGVRRPDEMRNRPTLPSLLSNPLVLDDVGLGSILKNTEDGHLAVVLENAGLTDRYGEQCFAARCTKYVPGANADAEFAESPDDFQVFSITDLCEERLCDQDFTMFRLFTKPALRRESSLRTVQRRSPKHWLTWKCQVIISM